MLLPNSEKSIAHANVQSYLFIYVFIKLALRKHLRLQKMRAPTDFYGNKRVDRVADAVFVDYGIAVEHGDGEFRFFGLRKKA